jgi:hypothetical protein
VPVDGLLMEAEAAEEDGGARAHDGAILYEEHGCARDKGLGVVSRDACHCSYAQAKMMASSREAGCWSTTSVSRGSPKPVMKS